MTPAAGDHPEDVITGYPDHHIINGDTSWCVCPEHSCCLNHRPADVGWVGWCMNSAFEGCEPCCDSCPDYDWPEDEAE
jgi:hypothetical protein